MRRDYFTFELQHVDDEAQPEVHITFEGPADVLEERLTASDDVDVAFRYQTPADDDSPTGVFSVTDRMTGEFILEVNTDAAAIETLVDAARDHDADGDTDGFYAISLEDDGDEVFTAEKRTLLVYDNEGSLLRQHSLIPSGVEL